MEFLVTIGYYASILFVVICAISILDTVLPLFFKALGFGYLFRILAGQVTKGASLIAQQSQQVNRLQYRNFKTIMIIGNLFLFLKKHLLG